MKTETTSLTTEQMIAAADAYALIPIEQTSPAADAWQAIVGQFNIAANTGDRNTLAAATPAIQHIARKVAYWQAWDKNVFSKMRMSQWKTVAIERDQMERWAILAEFLFTARRAIAMAGLPL